MRPLLITILSLIFFISPALGQSSLESDCPVLRNAHYGVLVKKLAEPEYLKAYNHNKSFTPASLTKLITTATALEMLSPNYHYMTKLQYRGEIIGDVLKGDIIIKGDGDPSLGSKYFYEDACEFLDVWTEEIRVLGIRSIEGSIISDASVFDKQAIPDQWIWEDIGNYYGAGVYGLSYFDNAYDLWFSKVSLGDIAKVDSIYPPCGKLSFNSEVTGANNNRDNAYIYGSPWAFEKTIRGTIPAGKDQFKIKGAMPNPPWVFAEMLKKRLQAKGVNVSGECSVLWEKDSTKHSGISIWFSPMLSEIIKITNKESNNLYAEHLLKTLAADEQHPASTKAAIEKLTSFWKDKGLPTDKIKLYDGSGMSRANLLTPEFIVGIIDYMSQSANYESFYNSLAISGVDGTFKYFLDGTNLAQITRGKSGSMSGVRCYAGIIEKSPKEKYSFCIMVNNFTVSHAEARKAIESYLTTLFE